MQSMIISNNFKNKILENPSPLYVLAYKVGFHPSHLSRIVNGAKIKRIHDIRFLLLAEHLNFHDVLFEPDPSDQKNLNIISLGGV